MAAGAGFDAGRAEFIELSLRRSPGCCQSFVGEFPAKEETATPLFGIVAEAKKEKERKKEDRQECLSYKLIRADCFLDLRLINIEIRIDVLHVVVFFQGFNQTDHLIGLRAG